MSKIVTIEGTARDAKMGAVVVSETGGAIYVEKLDAWPGDVHGKNVRVTGILATSKLIPDPVNEKGELVAGAWGEQTVLRDATWEVVGARK